MRASTILTAYVASRHVVQDAHTDMVNARYGSTAAGSAWDKATAVWQRRSKQRARFLERLQHICAEYDHVHAPSDDHAGYPLVLGTAALVRWVKSLHAAGRNLVAGVAWTYAPDGRNYTITLLERCEDGTAGLPPRSDEFDARMRELARVSQEGEQTR